MERDHDETATVLPPYALRTAEAARFLSISESSFRRLAGREGLVGLHLDGPRSAVLFRRVDLEGMIDRLHEEQS